MIFRSAEAICGNDERIKRINAEESRQRSLIESLQPWLDLDMPLGAEGTQRAGVVLGSFQNKVKLSDVESALSQASEEAELFPISQDKSSQYVAVVYIREAAAEVQEVLRTFGFTAASFTGFEGTARETAAQADKALNDLAAEKSACAAAIADESVRRDELNPYVG